MDKVETALDLFKQRFNRAQSTLAGSADKFALDRDPALKVGCDFGGGFAGLGGQG
jgi:hypothetical protein